MIPTYGEWLKHVAEDLFRFSRDCRPPPLNRRAKSRKEKVMKKAMKDYLSSNLQEAKAIRQAMREKKMPLLAECITIKTDKDGTKSKD